jgi:adrenodoxin-NADP+ reductase
MKTFQEIMRNEKVTFRGNVCVGRDIQVSDLLDSYSAVVLAVGASSDNKLGVPGEEITGVVSARTFVNWYNGHPDFANYDFQLEDVNDVVIIGQGNVALDCARILMKDPDVLDTTDISRKALNALRSSRVRSVSIIGRRSHVQIACKIKETRELSRLPGVVTHVSKDELKSGMTSASEEEIKNDRPRRRLTDLITGLNISGETEEAKAISLRFLLTPTRFEASATGRCKSVCFDRNILQGPPFSQRAVGTGEKLRIPCQLVLVAAGYKCESLPGVELDPSTNTLSHIQGRVTRGQSSDLEPHLYVTGWYKRGAQGIIGTNIPDAKQTADSILTDYRDGNLESSKNAEVENLFSSLNVVSWDMAERIHAAEETRGNNSDPQKPRVKMISVNEMLLV